MYYPVLQFSAISYFVAPSLYYVNDFYFVCIVSILYLSEF